jgi:hypothetical protein
MPKTTTSYTDSIVCVSVTQQNKAWALNYKLVKKPKKRIKLTNSKYHQIPKSDLPLLAVSVAVSRCYSANIHLLPFSCFEILYLNRKEDVGL